MDEKKTEAFAARVTPSLRKRVNAIHSKNLTTDASVMVLILEAFCDTVERTGRVSAPYTMLDAQEIQETSPDHLALLVAEAQAEYKAGLNRSISNQIAQGLLPPKASAKTPSGK